jgi:hypothetical protein
MEITRLVRTKNEPLVGEMRLHYGQRSMCINPRVHYAGGIGPLWATEGVLMEFSLEGSHRYYRGYCKHVSPKTKTVTFAITEGNTWGKLAQGSTVGILASRFTRCHIPDPMAPNLVNDVAIKEAEAKAKSLFAELSSNELNSSINESVAEWTRELIGENYYQRLLLIINGYNDFREELLSIDEWYIRHPNKGINKKRMRLMRAIDGIKITKNT